MSWCFLEQFSDNTTPHILKTLTNALLVHINLRSLAAEKYQDMASIGYYRSILGSNNANYLREQIEVTASYSDQIQRFFEATDNGRLVVEPDVLYELVSYLQACSKLYDMQEIISFPSMLEGSRLYTLTPSVLINLQIISTECLIVLIQSMPSSSINTLRPTLEDLVSQRSIQRRKASFTAVLQNISSVCEISSLSCCLLCKASDVIAKYNLEHSYLAKKKNTYAEMTQIMVNSCMELLCVLDEVDLYFPSTSAAEHMKAAVMAIGVVKDRIMTMFHHQCSIIVNEDHMNQDTGSEGIRRVTYSTIGLASHFGRQILQFVMAKIFSKPSSVIPCLTVLKDILPDDINDNFSGIDVAAQQLRLYWRDMIAVLFPDILKLHYLILSNNQIIVRLGTNVLHQLLGLFPESERLHFQFRVFIQKELNLCIQRAIDFGRLKDISYHTKFLMYQNEVIIGRWLKFTGELVYYQEMHEHFNSSFQKVKMAASDFDSFSARDGKL